MIPTLHIVAPSGTGKTSLLEKLIPLLGEQGLRLGVIKHTHHELQLDKPGKDSYRLRKAGATQTLLGDGKHWLMSDDSPAQAGLESLSRHFNPTCIDLILVEGFKAQAAQYIHLHRQAVSQSAVIPDKPGLLAVASDNADLLQQLPDRLPLLDLNNAVAITAFIFTWWKKQTG